MKKGLSFGAIFFVLFMLALVPHFVSAASTAANTNIWDPTILNGPLVTCSGDGGGTVTNTCQSFCDLLNTVVNVVYYAMAFVLWIITPITFAVGGIMYMFAGANPGMASTAKSTLVGALIAVAIVLCSWLILNTLVTVLGITGIGGFGTNTCQTGGSTTTPPPSTADPSLDGGLSNSD